VRPPRELLAIALPAVALAIALGGTHAAGATPAAASSRPVVYQISIDGGIDPAVARAVSRAIHDAEDADAAAVLVRLDTPGGLLTSEHSIVESIQGATVPVVCWVGPSGARAASAGTFILIGCPVAAMAPGTNVGAAHPITSSGGTVSDKVTNDAVAHIRSLAESRGRNADWAEKAVRKSVSISSEEAVRIHVADLLAPSIPALLQTIDGDTVETAAGSRVLHVAGATTHQVDLSAGEEILHWLSDADLGFLLFVFGIAGLVFEVLHPGLNVPGLLGIISLILSLAVFDSLPVNAAGILLLIGAFISFIIDIKAPGHGLPTLAGITLFVLGGLFLYHGSVDQVTRPLLYAVAVGIGLFFAVVTTAAIRARKAPVVSGVDQVVGATGVVTEPLDPDGQVRVRSEVWRATLADATAAWLPVGSAIRVNEVRGLTLVVEPAMDAGTEPQPGSIKWEMKT
jgi:membrane-bound serine protease (ClpP class)